MAEWFWWSMMSACVLWYSAITLYVAIKGAGDIRGMLSRLAHHHGADAEDSP